MTGQKHQPAQQYVEPSPLLRILDEINPARQPVWTREAGAIVLLLNGERSVLLPEVVS
jgi:hypothetical protein